MQSFQIEGLNIEIAVFLRYLRSLIGRRKVQINRKTVELFSRTVLSIDDLVANAIINEDTNDNTDDDDVDFLFHLDDNQYKLRRYIMCTLCLVRQRHLL